MSKESIAAPIQGLDQSQAGQIPGPLGEPAVPQVELPPEIAGKLYDAALEGDIKEIRALIDQLERLDPQYRPLTAELRRLARTYRVKQIRDLLARKR